jgi:hypothetical protein
MSYTVQKWDNNTAEIAYKLYAFDTDFIIEKEVLTGTSTESTYYNSNVSRETITEAWANRTTKTYDYTLKDKLVDNRFNRNFLAFEDAYSCSLDDSARKGININVAEFPYLWIFGNGGAGYYPTYTGDTFLISGSGCIYGGGASDYDAVTSIDLSNQNLNTNFSNDLLSKFNNLNFLFLNDCDITSINTTSLSKIKSLSLFRNRNLVNLDTLSLSDLEFLHIGATKVININVSNNSELNSLDCSNIVTLIDLDISNNTKMLTLKCQLNQLDNIVNSQILIDLDTHGLSSGYFRSSISGGGTLTTAGTTAKANLQGKGWTIVGI